MTSRNAPGARLAVVALVALATIGCEARPDERLKTLHQKADALTVENEQLQRQVLECDAKVAGLNRQVEMLQSLGPDRLDKLFTVDRIQFARLTGGADYDGVPGHDGVTVYLQPVDADGHVIKAAGEIIVELLDTSEPGKPRSLGQHVVKEREQLRKMWHDEFMTNHYTIKCPWSTGIGPPRTPQVLINVTFNDFLTGKRFTTAKQVEVTLPAASSVAGR